MSKQAINSLPYTLVQVGMFKIPDLPIESGGQISYKLKCVTREGKQAEYPCTEQAYKDFQKFRPDKKTKVFFYLKVKDGLVFDYSEVMGPPPAGMFKQEMADGRIIESSERLIFERKVGDKEFDPVFTPAMVGVGTVSEILAALNSAKELEPQDQILGKYSIYEVAQRAGKEVVTVDLGR